MLTRLMCTARAVEDEHHDIELIAGLSCCALETLGLTGVQLATEGGRLMYCLEGDREAVRRGYALINADPRIERVSLITSVMVYERHFDELLSMPLASDAYDCARPSRAVERALSLLGAVGARPTATPAQLAA